jgi:3,2-trans-enoyl-CoA isomerase
LDGGKVNEINSQMSQELKHVFLALDKDESVRGVILSGRPHGFSAGLDIVNIAKDEKLKIFTYEISNNNWKDSGNWNDFKKSINIPDKN